MRPETSKTTEQKSSSKHGRVLKVEAKIMDKFIVTHETVVLDTNFEKCEISGFVELTVSLKKEYFYVKEQYHDSVRLSLLFSLCSSICFADRITIESVSIYQYLALSRTILRFTKSLWTATLHRMKNECHF